MKPIGIFGGTFDPIHYGHLRPALEILEGADLAEVRFIPCGDPPHRGRPLSPADFRLEMVRRAVEGQDGFRVDDREVRRSGPSYTTDTLDTLRREFPDRSLCLILGTDAFLGLPKWHQWTRLLELAHIIVAHRPGWRFEPDAELAPVFERCRVHEPADLRHHAAGRIFSLPVSQLEISSTTIRETVARGGSIRYLTPDPVAELAVASGHYSRSKTTAT